MILDRLSQKNMLLWLVALLVLAGLAMASAAMYGPASPVVYGILLMVGIPLIGGVFVLNRLRSSQLQQQRTIQALATISRAVRANQSMDALLATIYRELADLLAIDYFTVALCDADGRHLYFPRVVRQGRAVFRPGAHERQAHSLIDHVLSAQAPLLLAQDAAKAAQRFALEPPEHDLSTWLGVPLLSAGRVLGVLEVGSGDPNRRFGVEEQYLLNIIASATSAAIDNAQLYKQQAERAARLGNLNAVLALLTETLSPDDVLDTVISSASAVSEATAVAVYLRTANGTLMPVRSAGLSEEFAHELMLENQVMVAAGEAKQPVIVEDVANDRQAGFLRATMQREGKDAWVELPLAVSGKDIGAVVLYYDAPQMFQPEEIEWLRAFANQAAQAIRNADLYAGTYQALEDRVEQLSTLAALGRQLLATTDLRAISNRLLHAALEATGTPVGAVVLRDRLNGSWMLTAQRGYPAGVLANPALLTEGLTGRVLREGRAIWCENAQDEPGYVLLVPTTRAQLSVPIRWQGATLGAITLESEKNFENQSSDFVAQLVNQAVLAMENARLFDNAAEGRDRMQAILDAMAEGLILIDQHQHIALANPRCDLLGLESDRLIGESLASLLDDPHLRLAERMGFQSNADVLHALQTLTAPVVQTDSQLYTLTTSTAPCYLQRQIIPVRGEQGSVIGLLLVFSDETERHNLERAREEFSQMIIHDLRSPLTAVTSSVDLLTEIMPPDNEFSDLVARTAGASQRAIRKLLNRVDSLLDISRMKSGQMSLHLQVAELQPLVENACAELEPLARELNIIIEPQLQEALPKLIIDTEKIERVVLNLVDNALKFSPRQSTIVIRTQVKEGDILRVEVIDCGPGIPEGDRENIFDRFVQIQNQAGKRRGSGLGLNFCKLAVEAHGGSIWIEDNASGGSIFVFELPVAGDEALAAMQ